ncbi:uncharacterized protein CDAR_274021 [Caerostris darwini]|uniref:Uncharacterized protein n=1 Tax=Caerostris darwini TaxID=1538125 RepID=A0AAV4RF56_9ARAC|nr:uncharacterized protein CDAR_274021 [Caerostris darwini]
MYSFVRGARLFVKGAREPEDPDNLPDPGDVGPDHHMSVYHQQSRSQMASASQESKEVFRSAHNRSGLRTVHTSRVIRKTTTLTRGDQKVPVRTSGTQHEAIRSSSVASMTENGSRNVVQHNFKSVHRSDLVDNDVHVKRIHRTHDTTDARKKVRTNKVSPFPPKSSPLQVSLPLPSLFYLHHKNSWTLPDIKLTFNAKFAQ